VRCGSTGAVRTMDPSCEVDSTQHIEARAKNKQLRVKPLVQLVSRAQTAASS